MGGILQYGWHFLFIAVTGEMVIPFILGACYKGYSHTNMVISSLGTPSSPVRKPFNCWMFMAGTLFLLAIPAIYTEYVAVSKVLTVTCVLFTGVFAIGACIFSCFFTLNETKDIVTTTARIHGVGSAAGFTLFLFVPLLLGVLSFKRGDLITATIAFISFLLAVISFVLFIMADKAFFSNTSIAKEGLWQRCNLLFMYLPLAYVAANKILMN